MSRPNSAAAIILVRESPELEVFWMRRAAHLAYQGGFYAFPGGKLDPREDAKMCAA
ncbi:MAG: NUDIX domain-containing protein, partial [Acidobacteria bacterium]|nr:NUDIX domain-containing protein [Acidobacteriota bacterium]